MEVQTDLGQISFKWLKCLQMLWCLTVSNCAWTPIKVFSPGLTETSPFHPLCHVMGQAMVCPPVFPLSRLLNDNSFE